MKTDPLTAVEKLTPSEMLASVEVVRKRVLHVEDWAGIRCLHRAEGLPVKVIARLLGISRNTVKSAFAARSGLRGVNAPPRGSYLHLSMDC